VSENHLEIEKRLGIKREQNKRHYDRQRQLKAISHSLRKDGRTMCGKIVVWNTFVTDQEPTCMLCRKSILSGVRSEELGEKC
jgi:hypothetical protein